MHSVAPFVLLGAAADRVVSALMDRRYAGAASAVDARNGRLIGDRRSPGKPAKLGRGRMSKNPGLGGTYDANSDGSEDRACRKAYDE